MLPMGRQSEAFKLNKKDGFCLEIHREFAEPYNICFDSAKIRDMFAQTIYIN